MSVFHKVLILFYNPIILIYQIFYVIILNINLNSIIVSSFLIIMLLTYYFYLTFVLLIHILFILIIRII